MIHEVVNTTAAAVTSTPVRTHRLTSVEGVVQIVISAAATVLLQGSMDEVTWVTLGTYTASAGQIVALFPSMRADVSGNTGTVTVRLSEAG